jgi:RNA polymerase sigma-70 factor (ECF subfamily)
VTPVRPAPPGAGAPSGRWGEDDFRRLAEPFRPELLAHCYRLLGSVDEAEDLVQETLLRAWRSSGAFEGRSSLRVWLYRIATNACLNALRGRRSRPLPSGLGAPSADPEAQPVAAAADVPWLQPIPDALVTPESADPAAIVAGRESLRLSLVAGLQLLPPRQRAVLLLREVLAFRAAEVATMLDTTVPAVKSTLQRARARLDEAAPAADDLVEPDSPEAQALLDQYVAGFERADADALERALRHDAAIEMVGAATWFSGKATCVRYLATVVGAPGDWRMVPTRANGQPAVAAYRRGEDGAHAAFGVAVLDVTAGGIRRILVVGGADVVARFGFPPAAPGGEALSCRSWRTSLRPASPLAASSSSPQPPAAPSSCVLASDEPDSEIRTPDPQDRT